MTEESLQILRNISLVEVMRANGYEPSRVPKSGGRATFVCPLHSDHDPSMTDDDQIPKVELTEPVEPTKFDRHMRKARRDDIRSRRQAFLQQGQARQDRNRQNDDLAPSVY